MKKAQISMNMIVYIAIALLVLVLIVAVVTGGFGAMFSNLSKRAPQDGCWLDRYETMPTMKCIEKRDEKFAYTVFNYGFVDSDEYDIHYLLLDRCSVVLEGPYDEQFLNYSYMIENYRDYCHDYRVEEFI